MIFPASDSLFSARLKGPALSKHKTFCAATVKNKIQKRPGKEQSREKAAEEDEGMGNGAKAAKAVQYCN